MSTYDQSLKSTDLLKAVANALSKVLFDETEVRNCRTTQDYHMADAVVITCPSLSLLREKEHSGLNTSSPHYNDRKLAEDHAVHLMSRPLVTKNSNSLSSTTEALRHNILSSLALLVDSRLHAYTDLLERHAVVASQSSEDASLSQWVIREKNLRILAKGAQVEATSFSTQFQCAEATMVEEDNAVEAPLQLIVSMDLCIPTRNGKTTLAAVSFHTSGRIRVTFSKEALLDRVIIDLDTRELLLQMVRQAALAVTTIVDFVSSHQEVTLPRSASFLAMPPPALPIAHRREEDTPRFSSIHPPTMSGLDLLCSAAEAELPVVSPHFGPVVIDDMEDDDYGEEDVSNLSVDQCADIIDVCLFGQRTAVPEERPHKRTKIEDFPSP